MNSRISKSPAAIACTFAAYFALGKAGLALGGFTGPAAAVWPPSGFALVATMLLGRRAWLGIFAGAFVLYASLTGQIAASLAIAIGNSAEAVVGAALVERLARGHEAFTSARTIFRFAVITAFVSLIGALGGAAGMTIARAFARGEMVYTGMTWWLMDFSGILVVAPFIAIWVTTPVQRGRWLQILEGVGLVVLLVAVGLVVFCGEFPSDVKDYPLEFLCLPFLIWAAFRFGRRTMAAAILILSGLAVWGTLHGFGPFARDSRNEAVVLVQAYTSVIALMGLVLAAVVAEHTRAEAQLLELATTDSLTGLVNYRRLIEVMKTEIARSGRTGRPFALLLVDMNGLKRINDRQGHLVGSRAICRVADALRSSCRTIDTVARFGGDEFAVVLTETGREGGDIVLRRLEDRLAADAVKPTLSVSGGVATYPQDGETVTLLLRSADKLLYEAKARAATARKAAASSVATTRTGTLF